MANSLLFFIIFSILIFQSTASGQNLFGQLPGEWQFEKGDWVFTETWKKVSPQTMEGTGFNVKAGRDTSDLEYLRLITTGKQIFYIAKVAANTFPVAFKLVSDSAETYVFENPHHDFPQRIKYQFISENQLYVRVESYDLKGFSLHFKRKILTE